MTNKEKIEAAKEKFGLLLEEQLSRVERMKSEADFVDYSKLDKIIIGVTGGDRNWAGNYRTGTESSVISP